MEGKKFTLEELPKLVIEVLAKLAEQGAEKATVLALRGDLGAGKTTFMQSLAKELRVNEDVTSPTFVIMKGYELLDQTYENLVHIDAYRIEELDEMRPLGFSQLLAEPKTLVCIEWAENISDLLPADTLHMTIEINGEERSVKFN